MVNPFDGAPIISSYTRAQALEDGDLVDIAETGREAGFLFPVALTRHAWAECVALPEGYKGVQDEAGRLWDVLWMASCAVRAYTRSKPNDTNTALWFSVYVRPINKDGRDAGRAKLKRLVVKIGPGDEAEPVITIMFPEDD
jgi:hypothetical protein